jgi:hypothetical protein
VSLIKKQKDILSHDPLVSIFSNNDLLTISVDTDSEDLNRQPKNIKISNADLKELTIQISGFDTLENNDVGRYFTCSGTVELVNTLGNGEEKRFVLAEPKIKVNVVKKGHLPQTEQIKQLVRNAWMDAFSDGCQNINQPYHYEDETWFERFKGSIIGKFVLIVLATFFAAFIGLAIFGYVAGKKQQDPTLEIANQIAQDPEALKQLLNQYDQQNNQSGAPTPQASPEQAAEQERQQEISSFGLDAGSSE